MPKITPQYLLAVQEYLKSLGRPNTMPYAVRWAKRLTNPLYRGPRV